MTAPTVQGTCLTSDQLGKLGSYCRASGTPCDSGQCLSGVCLSVPTGNLNQACNSDGSCNPKGLVCASLDGTTDKKCYCADDSKVGQACDDKGSVCVGNSFDKIFQYMYPGMYATLNNETSPPTATKANDSVSCFNSCAAGSVRANYDSGQKNCYCYPLGSQDATYVVLDPKWTAAYVDAGKFPKTTAAS